MRFSQKYANLMTPSFFTCFTVGVFFFLVDLLSKKMAFSYFVQAEKGLLAPILLFQFLGVSCSLTYATNLGAAWGYFSSAPFFLLLLRIALIGGLFAYLLFAKSAKQYRLPLVLIITGAIGNVCDFFLYGHVVDMIHCVFWGYDYPVFNVADSLIFVGTMLILFSTLVVEEEKA
jgi:signal peptidase II